MYITIITFRIGPENLFDVKGEVKLLELTLLHRVQRLGATVACLAMGLTSLCSFTPTPYTLPTSHWTERST